jgi:5-methylcytosine-specific restriction endonuclease McrA
MMVLFTPDCPLRPVLQNVIARCSLASCNGVLPRRRTRWCSDNCARVANSDPNHEWGSARAAALERDGHRCVRCGADGTIPAAELEALGARPEFPRDLGRDLAAFARSAQGDNLRRRIAAWNDAWFSLERRHQLEVNHIVPADGAHAEVSCAHHLDNLETLCHRCHAETTAAQARDRAARRRSDLDVAGKAVA